MLTRLKSLPDRPHCFLHHGLDHQHPVGLVAVVLYYPLYLSGSGGVETLIGGGERGWEGKRGRGGDGRGEEGMEGEEGERRGITGEFYIQPIFKRDDSILDRVLNNMVKQTTSVYDMCQIRVHIC